jgi:hypothetical protein
MPREIVWLYCKPCNDDTRQDEKGCIPCQEREKMEAEEAELATSEHKEGAIESPQLSTEGALE